MFENYGIQQIYSVCIRAITPVQIGNTWFGKDEVILYLRDVEAGKLIEENSTVAATGGRYSPRLIHWVNHSDMKFAISKGVLSKRDLNFLLDSDIVRQENITVFHRETHTVDSSGKFVLDYLPLSGIYCYDENNNKIHITCEGKRISVGEEYANQEVTIDYSTIVEQAHSYSIGENFLSNIVVKAEVQFLLKDDNTGEEYTGILEIPTANIVGDINLIMGKRATPIVGDFVIQSVQNKTESRKGHNTYSLKILDRDMTVM